MVPTPCTAVPRASTPACGKARQMGPRSLALHRVSSYGEEGFTGEVDVTVEFTWSDDNELIIEYMATTNKKTIVNLTHHAFFSLAGTTDPRPSSTIKCWR